MTTEKQLNTRLAGLRALLFDMDGVVYVGKQPLPGVMDLIDYLGETQRQWMFITNNASMTSQQFADKVAAMNVVAPHTHILGSSEATALWLADQVRQGWPAGKVFVMGMEGLRAALLDQGFELADDPFEAAYAVAGANFQLTYADLADITLAIRNGARFIGTNGDLTFPTERGQVPGAGSILALLTAATGVAPIVIGKPNPPLYRLAMTRLGATPATTLMVGDRYETDIAGAQALGLLTAGVLTGIDTRESFAAQEPPPDLIMADLVELLARLRAADRSS